MSKKIVKLRWLYKTPIKIRHNSPHIKLDLTKENKDSIEVTEEQAKVLLRNTDFEVVK